VNRKKLLTIVEGLPVKTVHTVNIKITNLKFLYTGTVIPFRLY